MSEELQASNRSLSAALAATETVASNAMSLQEVTAALSQAQTENEVAEVVLGKGLGVVGSVRGVLARVDGGRLRMICVGACQPETDAPLIGSTIDDDTPLTEAVRSAQPLWLETPDEHRARFPFLYTQPGIPAPAASAAVPLRHAGEIVGALAMFFADSAAFCRAKQAFTLILAQAAADALMRARHFDAERSARLGAETLARTRADVPTYALIPAFVISELKTAFQIGFLIFLPFLVIDLVVSSTLMSMGMIMLPPVFISLPFKILLFVLVDGWNLVTSSLVRSFGA